MDMRILRLLVSLFAVVGLLVGVVVVAVADAGDRQGTLIALGGLLTLAVQNLMQQLSTEQAATSAKSTEEKVDNVVQVARTEATAAAAEATRSALAQESIIPDPRGKI